MKRWESVWGLDLRALLSEVSRILLCQVSPGQLCSFLSTSITPPSTHTLMILIITTGVFHFIFVSVSFCPVWKVPPKNQNKSCCVWADYSYQNLCPFQIVTSLQRWAGLFCWLMGHSSPQEQTGGGQALELAFFLGWWGHFLNGILLQWQFWVWITPFMWYFQQLHQLWPPLPRRTRKLRAANGLTELWVPTRSVWQSRSVPACLFSYFPHCQIFIVIVERQHLAGIALSI